jgi:paraquat-inducible protein B
MDKRNDGFFYCQTDVNSMLPKRIHVGARIPKELYNKCVQDYGNITDAINAGLELLFKQSENKTENECKTIENECKTTENSNEQWIQELREQIRIKDESHKEITSNLKEQVNLLVDQMKIKDSQIEKLNDTLQNQVLNIHSLVQENTKLLPENREKKRWWEFWRN